MKKQKFSGYMMAVIGFLMLMVNAVAYIFNLDFKAPVLTVMGLVFVVIGMGAVRRSNFNN